MLTTEGISNPVIFGFIYTARQRCTKHAQLFRVLQIDAALKTLNNMDYGFTVFEKRRVCM